MDVEISIVGGGPAGLLTALNIGKNGYQVHLFESKDQIGKIEHCAGLLSIDGLEKIGLNNLPVDVIQNKKIIGAKLHSPTGVELIVQKKQEHAMVVNRSKLDQYLASLAQKNNVEIHLSSRVIDIKRNKNKLELKLGKDQAYTKVTSNIVILAEGRFPQLNEKIGLPSPKLSNTVFTTQYIVKNIEDLQSQYVELFQTRKYAPGFFAWIIPIDDSTAKVGLGSINKPASSFLSKFTNEYSIIKDRMRDVKIIKKTSGAIPLGGPIRKTYTDGVMVVGDAASQTKPTTGGGVIFGGIAAIHAAKIACEGIENKNYSSKFFSKYQKLWRKDLKKELFFMKQTRNYLNCISDEEIDKLFYLLNNSRMKNLFTNHGHVDKQGKIIQKCLFVPKLWPFICKTSIKFLLSSIKD